MSAPAADTGVVIRLASLEDVPALPPIEQAAGRLFTGLEAGVDEADTFPEAHLRGAQARGLLWVAATPAGRPVGFALVEPLDGALHLEEIDVHPDHARRGVGRRLVARVLEQARELGLPAVTLTTFRHVPWNAPWYARLGFRELAEADWTPGLRARVAKEERMGLDPARRLAMRCELGSP